MIGFIGENVLVTCSAWFVAPDGQEYRAVWGKLKAVHEAGKTLGFIPNRAHANWFIEIGDFTIMGCQVLYFTKCSERPPEGRVLGWTHDPQNGLKEFSRPSIIYFSE